MANVFFKIVGIFSTLAATLALIACIGLAVYGVKTLTHHEAPPSIVPPSPKLDAYLTGGGTNAKPDLFAGQDAAGKKIDPAKTEPQLKRISAAINAYAKAVEQDGVDADELPSQLQEKTEDLSPEQYYVFLSSLATECEKLPAMAVQQKKLESPLAWPEFVEWYTDAYVSPYREQAMSGIGQAVADAADKTSGQVLLGGAAAAFMLFVTFTMTLLMVRIESNTRNASRLQA